MIDTTVITPSMPDRAALLADAIASVQAQTVQPAAHLIRIETPIPGVASPVAIARQHNRLTAGLDTQWCSTLDDDDTYRPHHLETIRPALDSDADVIYTFAENPWVSRANVTDWTSAQIVDVLEQAHTCVPSNATIRMSALRAIGGWDETTFEAGRYASGATWDDWDLWLRLARAGAKFVCVPAITWDYRTGDWERASA